MADFPVKSKYQLELAYLNWKLALLMTATSKLKEAEDAYRRALDILEKLAANYPDEPFYRHELANNYWILACGILRPTGQVQQAEKAFRRALALDEDLVKRFGVAEYRWRLSAYLAGLGENLLEQGKHAEAAKVAEEMAENLAKDANNYERALLLLIQCQAQTEKDSALSEADRRIVARRYADRALGLLQERFKGGTDTPVLRELRAALPLRFEEPQAHYHLGNALLKHDMIVEFQQDMVIKAESRYRQALRLRPAYPEAQVMLGYTLWKQGKNTEAKAAYPQAEWNNWNRFWAEVERGLKSKSPKGPRDSPPQSPN